MSSADEHAYLSKRSADHRVMADRAVLPSVRVLHEQFAAAYARRAAAIVVDED